MTVSIWIIIISIFMILGIIGSVMPFLPGPPIAFVGFLIYKICPLGEDLSWWWMGLGFFLTLLSVIMEYLIPILTTKKFGGSKYGALGALLGVILGFFLPFGFVYGPFIGALIES